MKLYIIFSDATEFSPFSVVIYRLIDRSRYLLTLQGLCFLAAVRKSFWQKDLNILVQRFSADSRKISSYHNCIASSDAHNTDPRNK
jgi:hypothetical protein